MKRISSILTLLLLLIYSAFTQNVWLNELHYDNAGTDQGEFIEIALLNAGSYTLSDFTVTLYNGNNGGQYDTKTLDVFTQGNTVEGITLFYLVFPENGIQNGENDGLALSYQGTVVPGQFLSWEGVLTAIDGPAAGMSSMDIGVSESSSTPVGHSLQLTGTGSQYSEFTWQEPSPATMGLINTNQLFGAFTPDPEPSNYPTDFSATPQGFDILLTWTDSDGAQLPHGYLILAGDDPIAGIPEDGIPVADDTDMTDGTGAVNVDFGVEAFIFSGLVASTTYYFTIFPFTNSGEFIDYKTNGTPPAAEATTSNLTIIHQEDFESQSLGEWQAYSVTGDQVWEPSSFSDNWFARISGWSSGAVENDDWLISPPLNLQNFHDEILTFITAMNYTGPSLQVKISTDYSGSGSPYQAEWETLEVTLSPGNWEWASSGQVDISGFDGQQVHIAFQYTSNAQEAATWEVDDILIIGEGNVGLDDPAYAIPVTVHPNPATGLVTITLPQGVYEAAFYSAAGNLYDKLNLAGSVFTLDCSSYPKGMCILRIRDSKSGTVQLSKIILK